MRTGAHSPEALGPVLDGQTQLARLPQPAPRVQPGPHAACGSLHQAARLGATATDATAQGWTSAETCDSCGGPAAQSALGCGRQCSSCHGNGAANHSITQQSARYTRLSEGLPSLWGIATVLQCMCAYRPRGLQTVWHAWEGLLGSAAACEEGTPCSGQSTACRTRALASRTCCDRSCAQCQHQSTHRILRDKRTDTLGGRHHYASRVFAGFEIAFACVSAIGAPLSTPCSSVEPEVAHSHVCLSICTCTYTPLSRDTCHTLNARRRERPSTELRRRRHRLCAWRSSAAAAASGGVQNRQHCALGAPARRTGSGRCASHLGVGLQGHGQTHSNSMTSSGRASQCLKIPWPSIMRRPRSPQQAVGAQCSGVVQVWKSQHWPVVVPKAT